MGRNRGIQKAFFLFVVLAVALSPGLVGRSTSAQEAIFTDSGQELTSIRGNNSQDVALGDIDGDGDVDAVVAQGAVSSPEENIIWLNDGQASFSESDQFVGGSDSRSVALGDLDGDEDLDLFIANAGLSIPNDDEIWINQGGTFSNTQSLANGESRLVELGDLDGDTDLDALVAGSAQQQIWWNDGGGSFSAGPTLGHLNPYDFALGDLDNDSDLDIVMAGEGDFIPNQIFWNEWETSGDFPAGPELVNDGISSGVGLAHLDDDGYLDIYFASSQANVVWWNDGDGTFSSGEGIGNEGDTDVALGDLDGDGDVDAFVTRSKTGENANGVWLNNGDRTFTASSDALGNFTSRRAALADLDGDGDLDAFVANSGPNKVWLNTTDDGNGGQELVRPFQYFDQDLNIGLTEGVAMGDIDGDGDMDALTAGLRGLRVWRNGADGDPLGIFSLWVELDLDWSVGAALGDLDGDGDLDALATYFGEEDTIRIYLNEDGLFSLGQKVSWEALFVNEIALVDVDGDHDLDAILAGSSPSRVFLNGEDGNPPGMLSDSGQELTAARYVSAGDVDGDNDLDLVLSGWTTPAVWLNGESDDSLGTFRLGQWLGGIESGDNALGDLDGDSDLDIFLVNVRSEGDLLKNQVWLNGENGNPVGTFADSGQQIDSVNSSSVSLGDLNGDGDLDAFITTGSHPVRSQSNLIWLNHGDGTGFLTNQCLGSVNSFSAALADVDGDGDLDAFVGNLGIDRVWLNGEGEVCFCIVEWLYGEDDASAATRPHALGDSSPFALISQIAELQTYLDVRDDLLIQTRTGRGYARLYDQNNAEIYALLFADSTLRSEGLAALNLWAPHLQALLDGQGEGAIITADQVGAVEDFLTNLSAAASPELQAVISAELAKLPSLGDFVGMSMEEARAIVLNDTIFLPLVQQ